MDIEFKKPYEYEEEKRSFFILFFVVMITILDTLDTISGIVHVYDIFDNMMVVIGFILLSVLFLLLLIYTAVTCYKMKKNMVIAAKRYLIVRVFYLTSCLIITVIHKANNPSIIGNEAGQYESMKQLIFWEFIIPFIPIILVSGVWYVYFLKSKRCKEIVNMK